MHYTLTISNGIIINSGIHNFQKFIDNYCFIDNPKFLKASKQGTSVAKLSQKLYFYEEIDNNSFSLTRGLLNPLINYIKENGHTFEIIKDFKENEKLQNIESKIKKLRKYQIPLAEKLSEFDNGFVIVPTGGGKTVVMINEIITKKQKTIVMVTNTKLLTQFIERLKTFSNLTDEDIGIFGDGKKEIKDITIVLVQSFSKLSPKEIQEITSNFDLFFLDESHHLVADTILKVCKNVKSKRFYGLTATPEKQDGAATLFMNNITGNLLYRVTEQELEEDNVILKPDIIPVINTDSKIYDFYSDFFKLEDKKIIRFTMEQIKKENIDFNSLLPKNFNTHTTLITGKDINENKIFYNSLPQSIKEHTKLFLAPIFRKNQNVLYQFPIVIASELNETYQKVDMHKIKNQLLLRPYRANLITKIILNEFMNNRNKDPNILIISDRIEHLDFMYNNLPEKLKKYATVLYGKLKKKQLDEIDIKIEKKEYRIIFAIEKFVGEGWDVSHLDTLIMAYTLKDAELLKQLVGRVIRSNENKQFAQVYDIVDINNPITLSQFKKRFYNYYVKYGNYNTNEMSKILQYKS